jgi:hypothetical protein
MLTEEEKAHIIEKIEFENEIREKLSKSSESKQKPKQKDFWDKVQAVSTIIAGIGVAIVGYFLTGSVTQALKERELELSNLKEMRELILRLGNEKITDSEAHAAAMTLAVFGKYAVTPLIIQFQIDRMENQMAAEKALRVVALNLNNRTDVCSSLIEILNNRSRNFNWDVHRRAIRLIGAIGYKEAKPALEKYVALIKNSKSKDGLEAYKKIVSEDRPPNFESIELLERELKLALQALEQ